MSYYKCPNCGDPVSKSFLLCDDCKEQARKLDRSVDSDKYVETKLREQEKKPRNLKDIFGGRK